MRKVAQARRPAVSLPLALIGTSEIERGMHELDNFGFRTSAATVDQAGLTLIPGKYKKNSGFHVSDLWSHKQQQEFLKRLRLERAQYARERQVSFLNYLIENRKKLAKPLEPELLVKAYYQTVEEKMKKRINAKRAMYELGVKSHSEASLPNFSPAKSDRQAKPATGDKVILSSRRIKAVKGIIDHCDTTLRSFKQANRELVQTTANVKTLGVATSRVLFDDLETDRPWIQGGVEKKHRTRSIIRPF